MKFNLTKTVASLFLLSSVALAVAMGCGSDHQGHPPYPTPTVSGYPSPSPSASATPTLPPTPTPTPNHGTVAVDLGSAENYVILCQTGVSSVPTSAITGNIGCSPAAASYITGFSLVADPTNVFSTSSQVIGKIFAADYAPPTPANMTTAISDMQTAFTDAASRPADATEVGAGDISGMTLVPGVYKWGTGVLISTDVYLDGNATDVWIFEIAQDLTMANAQSVHLTGGALAQNVFWQVSGAVNIGTTDHFEGIVLSQTAISLGTGASVNGRLFAQSAVTMDSCTVVEPN